MTNLQKTIAYETNHAGNPFKVLAFWAMIFLAVFFFLAYVYSIYFSIDLSYKTEEELKIIKNESIFYQQAEERYARKLESLQEEGRKTLGLENPKNQIFIERFSSVARAESRAE